jgi:hypothetical protein
MRYFFLCCLLLTACAGQGSGILAQFNSAKPLDPGELDRHCDMEDAAACLLAGKPVKEELARVPLVQGLAPANKAVFAALLTREQKLNWFLRESGCLKLSPLPVHRSIERPFSPYRVEQILATQLEPGKTYELLAANAMGQLVDRRVFSPLPGPDPAPLRFALLSGTDDHSPQAGLWRDLASRQPEIVFSLGNNVFATSRGGEILGKSVGPEILWSRYVETRWKLPVFKYERLIPFAAIWNDRDFGMNGGDKSYAHIDDAREVMDAFFPSFADAKTVMEGPGVSLALKIAGETFLLFDDRSFRGREEGLFGRIQEDWALTALSNRAGPVWLMNGESWEKLGKRSFLPKLARTLKRNRRAPTFLAFGAGSPGDTVIRAIPLYSSYEFASGFHRPQGESPRKKGDLARENGGYLLLEAGLPEKKSFSVKATARSDSGVLFEKTVKLKSR